jgi:hypothetical protein
VSARYLSPISPSWGRLPLSVLCATTRAPRSSKSPGVADPVDIGECSSETAAVEQSDETDDVDEKMQRVEAALAALAPRTEAIEAATRAIETALNNDDVATLPELLSIAILEMTRELYGPRQLPIASIAW